MTQGTQWGTALVTGASGWLGARLRLALEGRLPDAATPPRATALRALVVGASEATGLGADAAARIPVDAMVGDLRVEADVRRFCAGAKGAVLFHCAGLIHPRWRVRDLFDVNVEGTRKLLEAAEAAGVRRAVVMSSNSPFGANPSADQRFDEDSPYAPYMAYGRSKQQMERVARAVAERGRMEVVLVRAPWFYGPGQPPRQSEFFRMIRAGRAPIVGGGRNLRSMSYVDDLARGLLRCAEAPAAAGRAWWLGDARPYTTLEIIETVARVLERDFGLACRPQRLRVPGFVADLARLADRCIQGVGLYEQRIHVLSEMNLHIACSVERARVELGHAPSVGLEEGMRRSIAWCLEAGVEL